MENNNIPSNTTETESLLRKRQAIRIGAIALVILCSVLMAVMAGAMIAMWDTGKTSEDLFAVINGTYVEAKVREEKLRLEMEAQAADEAETKVTQSDGEYTDGTDTAEAEHTDDTAAEGETEADEENPEIANEVSDGSEEVQDGADATLNIASGINVYVDPNVNYPLEYRTVDASYFDDALFIGDSRLQGFGMYSGLPGTFYAATGFQLYKYETMKVVNTGSGKVPILDALPYDTFTKIYIKVGLNEMGGNDKVFESKYIELIDRLRQSEPRAVIYVHGILPVTAAKSSSDKVHNNLNVTKRNEQLQRIASQNGCYYLDVGSALAGPDGALPAEMAADGIHLKAQYMEMWKQYLLTHAVM